MPLMSLQFQDRVLFAASIGLLPFGLSGRCAKHAEQRGIDPHAAANQSVEPNAPQKRPGKRRYRPADHSVEGHQDDVQRDRETEPRGDGRQARAFVSAEDEVGGAGAEEGPGERRQAEDEQRGVAFGKLGPEESKNEFSEQDEHQGTQ